MAVKKIIMRPEGDNNYADELHPKTSVDMVEGIGDLTQLSTTEKSSLVGAVNEVDGNVGVIDTLVGQLEVNMNGNVELLGSQISNVQYDLYSLWLDQYYMGNVSGGINPDGSKTLFYDGFLNTDYTNMVDTSATVDTVNRKVVCDVSYTDTFALSATQGTLGVYTQASLYNGAYSNVGDGDTTGTVFGGEGATWNGGLSGYTYASFRLDLGSIKPIDQIRIFGETYGGSNTVKLFHCATSEDGVTWSDNSIATTTLRTGTDADAFDVRVNLNSVRNARYVEFTVGVGDAGTTNYCSVYEAMVRVMEIPDRLFKSATFESDFIFSEATLYLSVKKPSGASIEPLLSLDGSTFGSGVLLAERTDPLFPDYTEQQWKYTELVSGSFPVLQVNFSTTGLEQGEVKRFGVYLR